MDFISRKSVEPMHNTCSTCARHMQFKYRKHVEHIKNICDVHEEHKQNVCLTIEVHM
jgi:hypothetical protein